MADSATRRQYDPANPGPVARSFARYIATTHGEEFDAVATHFGGEHGPGLAQALFSFHNDWQRWRGTPESGDGVLSERQLEDREREAAREQERADKEAEKAKAREAKEAERAEKAKEREAAEAERKANREQREAEQKAKREAKEKEREEKRAAAEAAKAQKDAERAAKQDAANTAQDGADGDDSTSETTEVEVGRGALRQSKLRKRPAEATVGASEPSF